MNVLFKLISELIENQNKIIIIITEKMYEKKTISIQ